MTLLGKRFGKIRIIDRLGKGGMGEVYVGYDETLERKVAVKTIRGESRLDASAKARFFREAKVLSKLDHPNICQIHDLIETEDADILVLELIQGRDLLTAQKNGLTQSAKFKIAIELAEVLAEAHDQQVIHRDLKPENVMITEKGTVKVLDYGIARAPADVPGPTIQPSEQPMPQTDSGTGFRTEKGVISGTPMFMSPEQAQAKDVDSASDMYSFGLLLQWLFTGRYAYPENLNPLELLDKAAKGDTFPVEGLDNDLTALINRLKSVALGVRPSAIDTLDRLRWIEDKPRRRAKRRIKLGIVAVIVALLVMGTTISTIGFLSAMKERDRTVEEAEKANQTIRLLEEFVTSVDPQHKGKDLKMLDFLESIKPRLEEVEDPEIQARLFDTYSVTHRSLGNYDRAYDFAERAMTIRRSVLGENHPDTLVSLDNLTLALVYQGKYERAEQLGRQSLEVRLQVLGGAHPDTLNAKYNLAETLLHLGKYSEAEGILREVLASRRQMLGNVHPDTLASMSNLALSLASQGKFEETASLQQEVMETSRRVLGEDHPDTLAAMQNWASTLSIQKRYAEAEQFGTVLVKKCIRVLGKDHPDTLTSMNNLAMVLGFREKFEDADALHRDLIDESKRILGEDHPMTLTYMLCRADTLRSAGQYLEAEKRYREVLEKARPVLGEDHPGIFTAMRDLALTLEKMERVDEARILYQQASQKGDALSAKALERLDSKK